MQYDDKSFVKLVLRDEDLPKTWYNIQADMKTLPPPALHPQTLKPMGVSDLSGLLARECSEQELSTERHIDIAQPILDYYKRYRCTPLYRARGLEKALGTGCKLYYKYEGGNATGSHKLNSAVPQAFYNKNEGVKRITTETGAGQWGSALSMACALYGMECVVYMVRVSYNQKPYRRIFMETYGAKVFASPSGNTECGRNLLKANPEHSGSLGIAIGEAVEEVFGRTDTKYSLGSVLNHVCMHQTVIGLEAKKQMEIIGDYPDVVISCLGGGSNFAGIAFPFLEDKLRYGKHVRAVAVESQACPKLTKGVLAYDYGDSVGLGPVTMMYTLGHNFIPSGVHAGGLRYHGSSPLVSQLLADGMIEAQAYGQIESLKEGMLFAQTEGIIPAPESTHSIISAVREAQKADSEGVKKTILFNVSGNGYLDLYAYEKLINNTISDSTFDQSAVDDALKQLPTV